MALTKIGSIGINTGIAFAGVTTIVTLNGSDAVLSVGGTVNFVSDVSIGGTVSIAGTLTYEDVTNVDAVGLITARDGIKVGSGITLSKDGDGFFTGVITATSYSGIDLSDVTGATGDFSIADKIVHTGDTDTAIRFSAADTVTVETGGSERFRVQDDKVMVSVDFKPDADSSRDLGTNSNRFANGYFDTLYGDGSALTGIAVGIATTAASMTGITTVLDLSKDDFKVTASGITTVDVRGGTEGGSHMLRIVNSGITTVGFSTYFLFPSGGTPALPTTDGAISLISFTVHRQGAVGLATQLLAGSSVNFS